MSLRNVILAWLLIILLESFNGAVREFYIAPAIGDLPARRLGFFIGAGLILFIAWLTAPWIKAETLMAQLKAGGVWLGLMLVFELGLGYARGFSWEHMLSDYNPAQGGLMLFGLVIVLFAPAMGAWLRSKPGLTANKE